MSDDSAFYDRALRRIERGACVIGAAAAIFFLVRSGARDAAGCATAAAAAWFNLRWIERIAGRPGKNSAEAALAGLRLVLLALAAFAIIRSFKVAPLAVFAGLLAPVAAALVEAVYLLVVIRQ